MRSIRRTEPARDARPWWAIALILLGLTLAVMVLTSAAPAQQTALADDARATVDRASDTARLVLDGSSRLWIEGTSNLHDWSCETTTIDAVLRVTPPAGPDAARAVPARVDEVTVGVPVESLDCSRAGMAGNLRKALKADQHPLIRFRMMKHEIFTQSSDPVRFTVSADGRLTVAGETRPIMLTVLTTGSDAEKLRMVGRVDLNMTDFGVDPPTALFGALKTGDRVTVQFELVAGYEEIARQLGTDVRTLTAYLQNH